MEMIIILTFILIAIAVSIFVKNRGLIEFVSVVASFVSLVEAGRIAVKVANAGVYNSYPIFSVDAFGAIVMLIIAVIGFVSMIYSVAYLREETKKQIIGFTRVKQFFILLNFFLAAMFLAAASSNPVFAWIFIEATTLSTAFLISFYNKPSAMEAAWKYLIINSIGLLLGFFGTLLYFTSLQGMGEAGLTTWNSLMSNAAHLDPMIAKIAFVFVLVGYGTKVGLAPMHTWKPDVYSKAPAPVGALFSGALLPVALMILMKFKIITDLVVGPLFSGTLLISFGIFSITVASLITFSSKNYKRLLAYSSIEHAGIITLGIGFGGFGVFAAILHMIYHSLVKSALFLSAGNILLKYSSDKIMNIKGMLTVLPSTSILFFTGFLAITGTPPFGIFFTKISVLSAGMYEHPIVTIAAVFLMVLLFIGFFKQTITMIFGEKPAEIKNGEDSKLLIILPLSLLVIAFYLSFHIPSFLYNLIISVASYY